MIGDRLPSVQMAWRNLWRNRLRTVLAALGILVGVVAIAGLGIAGTALQYGATQQFEGLADTVQIRPGPAIDGSQDQRPPPGRVTRGPHGEPVRVGGRKVVRFEGGGLPSERRIGPGHRERLERVADNATVIPIKQTSLDLSTRNRTESVRVEVVDRPRPLYNVTRGDVPDPFVTGALVNEEVARELGIEVGDLVTIGDRSVRVQALTSDGGLGTRESPVVISGPIPQRGYDEVVILADDADAAAGLATTINATFNDDGPVFEIHSRADIGQRTSNFFNIINVILMGIGSISLFVASVSILNVLLMSTVERRGEIGILRAVGISRFEVLRMILTEAVLLGVLGGAGGALIATGLGALLYHVLFDDPTLVFMWRNVRFLVVAFGFGTVASLLSGLYPAWRAASADPVEAIRS
ncbi:MAG: ABC transporter permease [Halococcoides sp.]